MSKLLRFSLTLLAVLAALLLLPGVASANTPSAAQCAAHPSPADCQKPTADAPTTGGGTAATVPGGDAATAATPLGEVVPLQVPSALVAPDPITPTVPNCDALPGIGLPPCAPPACTPAGTTSPPGALPAPPPCLPAPPPTCQPTPGLGGSFCQFPDSDCPPPSTAPTAAAVTDGKCTPPITCDQFAQLFGFGDSCSNIPMCIPRDRVPPGFPIPIPSPPLCGPGAGGTPNPPTTPPGKGTYMPPPQSSTETPPQQPAAAQPAAAPAPTVTTTAQPTGKLAYTGLDLGPQLNIAWTLLVLGAGMMILGRRRA